MWGGEGRVCGVGGYVHLRIIGGCETLRVGDRWIPAGTGAGAGEGRRKEGKEVVGRVEAEAKADVVAVDDF